MVRLQSNERFLNEFSAYLQNERENDRRLQALTTELKASQKAPGGFGLAVPPELFIAFGTAAATAVGTGLGKLIWEKLKGYVSSKPTTAKGTVVIRVEENKITLNLDLLGDEPPQILVNME